MKRKNLQGTPLEQAIARVADRRRRHDQRQAQAGLVRVTVTVPADRADELRDIAAAMRLKAERDAIMGTALA